MSPARELEHNHYLQWSFYMRSPDSIVRSKMANSILSRSSSMSPWRWLLGFSLCICVWGILVPAGVTAQDEAPPAANEVDAANAANAPGDPPAAPEKKQSYLVKFINDLGPEYFVAFLLLSFVFVALLVMNILATSRNSVCPVQLVEGFEQHLNEKKYQEAYELAISDESFLGQVLSAGLAKLQAGYAQAIEAMQ